MLGLVQRVLGGNALLIASVLAAIVFLFLFDASRIKSAENKGRNDAFNQVENQGEILNGKAADAHADARKPGALGRLRQDYCPAC